MLETGQEIVEESASQQGAGWCLEGYVDSGKRAWRTVIHRLPLRVGRDSRADLPLLSDKVSHRHAEIYSEGGGLWVRDLDSTNGTFVNGEQVRRARRLQAGDILRFADLEFRLTPYEAPDQLVDTRTKVLSKYELTDFLREQSEEFTRLLRKKAVRALFQPVVDLDRSALIGYELLSRGALSGFETAPAELFYIAESLGLEMKLSELCRIQGVLAAQSLPGSPRVFLNTHPSEIRRRGDFLKSLERLRVSCPDAALVVEIHEAAMADPRTMSQLREGLDFLGIQLAFDDFGTGQSRLMEIAEVPPDYVKFDMAFVRRLHEATGRRRKLVADLVELTRSLGITAIAEGVESKAELQACREAGFTAAQGFYLGLPLGVEEAIKGGGVPARILS